jgi:hypothetical protein
LFFFHSRVRALSLSLFLRLAFMTSPFVFQETFYSNIAEAIGLASAQPMYRKPAVSRVTACFNFPSHDDANDGLLVSTQFFDRSRLGIIAG